MLKNKKFTLILLLILALALVLRLRGFDTHYLFGSDTARDLLVAKGALTIGELPTVGSFSSSGPFVFGPNWYWFLMLPLFILPNVFLAPWLLLLALSLISVYLMVQAGIFVKNKRLGLIIGLVVAVSPVAAGYATYLTQHGLVEFFSCLAIFGFVAFLKTRKLVHCFLMAFALGCGLSLHYQVLNLLVLIPLLIVTDPRRIIPLSLTLGAGLLIPMAPLLWWDSQRGFQNTLHLIGYFKVGQYQIYVPNRWLTYIGIFWTTFLGRIIGGNPLMGAISGLLLAAVSVLSTLKRRLPKAIFFLLVAFLIQFIVFRYFRGERYDGYVVYFHGLLFVLVGWVFYELLALNKFAGFIAFMCFIFLSVKSLIPLQDLTNDAGKIFAIIPTLTKTKYAVYAKNLASSNCAFTFSYVLESQNRGDESGVPLGVCRGTQNSCGVQGETLQSRMKFQGDVCVIVNLENTPPELLTKQNDWYNFGKLAVYDDVQNWWKKN